MGGPAPSRESGHTGAYACTPRPDHTCRTDRGRRVWEVRP
ncbi:hypothetical protein SGM_4946 [Streptomyces griseoaurantiacus M045]|uniref:Uncharacterized protein n=1 Tax=Streptomyces griseoaurantiacus M045 TaxID=996637 RepID=F3NP82_9ACTN|nr:hypothetical protein SGM_4946 [Streptomyces griseoaurantiacus M045]